MMRKRLNLGEGFEKYAKTTMRAQFLNDMDRIVPWAELCELIAPLILLPATVARHAGWK